MVLTCTTREHEVYTRRIHNSLKNGRMARIYGGIYHHLSLNLLSTHAAYLIKIGDPAGAMTLHAQPNYDYSW